MGYEIRANIEVLAKIVRDHRDRDLTHYLHQLLVVLVVFTRTNMTVLLEWKFVCSFGQLLSVRFSAL